MLHHYIRFCKSMSWPGAMQAGVGEYRVLSPVQGANWTDAIGFNFPGGNDSDGEPMMIKNEHSPVHCGDFCRGRYWLFDVHNITCLQRPKLHCTRCA